MCGCTVAANFSGYITYVQDLSLLGCDTLSPGEWFLVFQRIVVPSSSRVEQFKKNYSLTIRPMEMNASQSFKMLEVAHPVTQHHIPEYWNRQQH